MLKKIILWTFYAAFIGVLVFGAVNRTLSKTGEIDGVGKGNAAERETADNHEIGKNNTIGQEDSAAPQLGGSVGYGNGESESHETTEHDWVTLTGTVSNILSLQHPSPRNGRG